MATIAVFNLVARGAGAIRARRGAGIALADQAVVSASNFVTIYLLARAMPVSEFGYFVLSQTALLLVTSLHNSLLVEPQNVIGSRLDRRRYKRFLAVLARGHLLFSALVLSVAAGVAALLWVGGRSSAASLVLFVGLTLVPWLGQEFLRRALYCRSAVSAALLNDAVCYGAQVLAVIALVHGAGRAGPDTGSALGVLGLASLLAVGVGLIQMGYEFGARGWRTGPLEGRRIRQQVWDIGRWLLGRNAVTWMGTNGHAWLVAWLLGPASLGAYRATIHLVNVINPLRQAAVNYLPPRANRVLHGNGSTGLSHWVRRITAVLTLLLLPALLVLVLAPDALLGLAYGDKLDGRGLGAVLALAATAQVLMFAKFPMDVAVIAMGGARQMFLVSLIPVLLLASVSVALIRHFGVLGVALSSLTIALVMVVTSFVLYRTHAARDMAGPPEK